MKKNIITFFILICFPTIILSSGLSDTFYLESAGIADTVEFGQYQKLLSLDGSKNPYYSFERQVYMSKIQNNLWSCTAGLFQGDNIEYKHLLIKDDNTIWEQSYNENEEDVGLDYKIANGETIVESVYNENHRLYIPEDYSRESMIVLTNWGGTPDIPTNIQKINYSDTIELSWTASKELDVYGYLLYRRKENEEYSDTPYIGQILQNTNYTDTNIVQDMTYYYRLKSVDSYFPPLGPLFSPYSASISAKAADPVTITFELDLGISVGDNVVEIRGNLSPLSWSEGQKMQEVGTTGTGRYSTSISFVPGNELQFKFKVYDSWEYIPGDNRVIIIPEEDKDYKYNWSNEPDAPELSYKLGGESIKLIWKQSSDIDVRYPGGYLILKSTSSQTVDTAHIILNQYEKHFYVNEKLLKNVEYDSLAFIRPESPDANNEITFIDTDVINKVKYSYQLVIIDASFDSPMTSVSNIIYAATDTYTSCTFILDAGEIHPEKQMVLTGEKYSWDMNANANKMLNKYGNTSLSEGASTWVIQLTDVIPGELFEYKYVFDNNVMNFERRPANNDGNSNRFITIKENATYYDNWGDRPDGVNLWNDNDSGAIYLYWSESDKDVTGITGGYLLEKRMGNADWHYINSDTELIIGNAYSDYDVKNGMKYSYRVYGIDSTDAHTFGYMSNEITVTPQAYRSLDLILYSGNIRPIGDMYVKIRNKYNQWDYKTMEYLGDSTYIARLTYPDYKIFLNDVINYRYSFDNTNESFDWDRTYTIIGDTIYDNWDFEPDKPTGFNIELIQNNNVKLTWLPSSEVDVVGYNIYRSAVNGGERTLLQPNVVGTEYIDTSVQDGVNYWYHVKATDGQYESEKTNEIVVTTLMFYITAIEAITGEKVKVSFGGDTTHIPKFNKDVADTSNYFIVDSGSSPLEIRSIELKDTATDLLTDIQWYKEQYKIKLNVKSVDPPLILPGEFVSKSFGVIKLRKTRGGSVYTIDITNENGDTVITRIDVPPQLLPESAIVEIDTNVHNTIIDTANLKADISPNIVRLDDNGYNIRDFKAYRIENYPDTKISIFDINNDGEIDAVFSNTYETFVTISLGLPKTSVDDKDIQNHEGKLIAKETLRLYRLNEKKKRWELVKDAGFGINGISNGYIKGDDDYTSRIVATVNHFSIYRILGTPQPEDNFAKLVIYPNPFIPSKPGHQNGITFANLAKNVKKIEIFDIASQKVCELNENRGLQLENNTNYTISAIWDGRNDYGQEVSSGIYIYKIITDNNSSEYGKVAVIR